jgi:O-antigen ligase
LQFLELHVDYIGFVTLFAIILSLSRLTQETNVYVKVILFISLLLTTAATLLTQSRGTLCAAVIALIILFSRNKQAVIVFSILFIIGVGITPGLTNRFDLTAALRGERVGINLTTYEIIKSYPIVGIGFGMETYGNKNLLDLQKYNARISPEYRQKRIITSPHNTLLDIAVRTGFVGLALYIYILFTFVRMGWKSIRHGENAFVRNRGSGIMAAFVCIFIQGIFADGMFGPQAIVLYTILAMMTVLYGLGQNTAGIARG